jgi:hypothetical protein
MVPDRDPLHTNLRHEREFTLAPQPQIARERDRPSWAP